MNEHVLKPARALALLVVHESGDGRAAIRRAVERSGTRISVVFEAASDCEALALISAVGVDLVFIHAGTPSIRSIETIARIRESSRRRVACILLLEDEKSMEEALATGSGADAHFTLPLDPVELAAMGQRVFSWLRR